MQAGEAVLVRHPLAPWPGPALAITAACRAQSDRSFACTFTVEGDLGAIVWPPAAVAARVDGLWRHTCLEVFVGPAGRPSYVEFNLAPSGQWAAYAFAGYRAPAPLPAVRPPSISATRGARLLSLNAVVDPHPWLDEHSAPTLEVGLSAVIEHEGGALGYYALCHPAERPDFHDRRGFGLRIECARRTGATLGGSAG